MANDTTEPEGAILPGDDEAPLHGTTRREFLKYSAGTIAGMYLAHFDSLDAAIDNPVAEYRIAPDVTTTLERMISFPMPAQPKGPNSGTGLYLTELCEISKYREYGYGKYTFAAGLPSIQRFDIMPPRDAAATASRTRIHRLLNFFTISDIHITDKEAPNQLIYLQQQDPADAGKQTSIYSPVMLYTTHVLDAAIQTINVLHQRQLFDFGISLGDTCNSTQYNELRWYLDVIDGEIIHPSSGAHLGDDHRLSEAVSGCRARSLHTLVSGSRQSRSFLAGFDCCRW